MSNELKPEDVGKMLIAEAMSYIGVRELGANKGAWVEEFQRAVDDKAISESWCMAFAQYVCGKVCKKLGIKNPLHPSEHCQTVLNHTDKKYVKAAPFPGALFIAKEQEDDRGHTGYCLSGPVGHIFRTVEGNTNDAGSADGDGVYDKTRSMNGWGTKFVRGFIDVPQMICDKVKEKQ